MQRYRINYHWLIGVFVTSLVVAVTAFFVQRWQVERRAGVFLTKAEDALAEGKNYKAFSYFRNYVQLRPEEDAARIKMAEAAIEVVKSLEVTSEQRNYAFGVLDQTVRTTDDAKLRRELAEIVISFRPQDAIKHLEDLLDKNPNDPELNAMLIQAWFKAKDFQRVKTLAFNFVGYDRETGEFEAEKKSLKGEPDVYSLLSNILIGKDKNTDLARRVIEQMVVNNPDSPKAHLLKSAFHSGLKEYQEANVHLDKAYDLDPKDAAILSAKGMESLGSNFPGAKALYLEAMSDYEDAQSQLASDRSVALDDSNYEEAKEEYLEALSNLEKNKPSPEEASSKYEVAKSNYEEAKSQLATLVSAVQDDLDYQAASDKLKEAQSNFETALPNYEEAKEYISAGLKEHPDSALFYRLMAGAEQSLGQKEAALKILDQGIVKLSKNQSINLIAYKIDLLFGEEDYPAVNREIKRLAQLNQPDLMPIVDYYRARMLFRKRQWAEAAKELKRVRPLLFGRPSTQKLAGTMLGICYETQGINDLALQAYDSVLEGFPKHSPAMKGRQRVWGRMHPKQEGIELDKLVKEVLELPEAEQDWSKVDELVTQMIEEKGLGEARAKLLRAKILIKRDQYDDAKALIKQAYKVAPEDIDVHFAAIFLVASDPMQGPARAMKLLDKLEKKWGTSLRTLARRAELLYEIKPEDVTEQLRSLVTRADDLTEVEKLQLDKVLGLKFEQLGKIEEAREFYEKSAEQEQNNLPIRMHLFDLAHRQQDDAAMQKAQAAVLDFVKSKTHPNYILTEVKRRIMSFGRREIDQAELAKSRELLDTALSQRPKWYELHIVYGQLLLLVGGDIDLALQHFDKALESGPAKANAVRIQVMLLVERGLYEQARKRMDLLRPEIRGQLLGRTEAEILIRTGDTEAGYKAAKQFAESQKTIPATQIWFSKIAQQVGELDVAATTLRSALQMNPADPDNWLRLIGLYAEQQKFTEVEAVIREAHLASEAEFLPLLTGKYYELVSRWQNAESIYLATYADQLDRLPVLHRLADFYLLWSKKHEANLGKASVYINRILRAANNGEAAADNPHVVWARQKAARILLAKQDYQQSLKAEALLRQSAVNSVMSSEESKLLADILISQNTPQSLLRAIQLLSELREQGRLSKDSALQLARIYSQTNQWDKAESILLELLAKKASDSAVQTTYIDLLIDAGEYSSADSRIKRLRKLDPKNRSLVQLGARLASVKGDQEQLNRLLTSLLPKTRGKLTAEQLQTTLGIAQLADRYGAYDLAGKLYKIYTGRVPSEALQLARFLAYRGDCDQALVLMKRLYSDQTDNVIQLANRMISIRRDEFGDKYDEPVDRMIDAALREDPDSVTRLLARAEAYEAQGKNEESIAAYDRLLQRDDLPSRIRAAAMNNLGFQLGLLKQRVDEAEQLINDAMKTFGPVTDMLDTRAIVHIAQEKYDLAIKDMELALSVSQNPVLYFHLAKACILAGDGLAARTALEKAQKLGFEKKSLSNLEKPDFEPILQQINSFQVQNAKL
ncbi:MAG: tetratricopeptide repeat protein [Planctomycetes bacterium]|nr:tetratricopeptide repeat protein [Planctomycetota bacterium]